MFSVKTTGVWFLSCDWTLTDPNINIEDDKIILFQNKIHFASVFHMLNELIHFKNNLIPSNQGNTITTWLSEKIKELIKQDNDMKV